MLHLALRMARYRIAALLAIACATLGGAAFITGIGVLAESGFRSHAPVARLAHPRRPRESSGRRSRR